MPVVEYVFHDEAQSKDFLILSAQSTELTAELATAFLDIDRSKREAGRKYSIREYAEAGHGYALYEDQNKKKVASPRKMKKPPESVSAVRKILDA